MPYNFTNQLDRLDFNFGAGGISYKLLIEFLYIGRMLRYFTQNQIKSIQPRRYGKIGTKAKLKVLLDHKYLMSKTEGVYQVSKKPRQIFEAAKLDWEALTYGKRLGGEGRENEVLNTDQLIRLMREPYFYHYFFLRFPSSGKAFVDPDALMVLKKEDQYRLVFIEIENSKKGNWHEYVDDKRRKYQILARKKWVYHAWDKIANMLNLHLPEVSDFHFSVRFIGNFDFDVGREEKGFEYTRLQ